MLCIICSVWRKRVRLVSHAFPLVDRVARTALCTPCTKYNKRTRKEYQKSAGEHVPYLSNHSLSSCVRVRARARAFVCARVLDIHCKRLVFGMEERKNNKPYKFIVRRRRDADTVDRVPFGDNKRVEKIWRRRRFFNKHMAVSPNAYRRTLFYYMCCGRIAVCLSSMRSMSGAAGNLDLRSHEIAAGKKKRFSVVIVTDSSKFVESFVEEPTSRIDWQIHAAARLRFVFRGEGVIFSHWKRVEGHVP